MTLLVAAVALGVLSAGWVVLPMIRRRMATLGDPIAGGVLDAEARRRVALASLREIEYDRIGGKLDDEDYRRLRSQLEREALLAIEAADAAGASSGEVGPVRGTDLASQAPPAFTITHACGFVNPPGSRFCSGCGARL